MPYQDPIKQKQAQRESYERNKGKVRVRAREQKLRDKQWIISLKDSPCMDCGLKLPHYIMHYHHRDPSQKLMAISSMVAYMKSRAEILSEIEKCDLLCANCHGIREWKEKI